MKPTIGRTASLDARKHVLFWSKVALPSEDGCMLWSAGLDKNGYGQFNRGDRVLKAHQIAWWYAYGDVPNGLVIDHLCQVKRCVSVQHLEVVTQAENARRTGLRTDLCRSGRHRKPELETGFPRQECQDCRRERRRSKYQELRLSGMSATEARKAA